MEVKEALELYKEAEEYWAEIYKAYDEDVRFSIGLDHYRNKTPEQCEKEGLLIVPVLPQFIHQVENDMRMNTPSINVSPSTDGDIETAKVFKGLVKDIEYKSNADAAYDTGASNSVRGGLGFARVDRDYVGPDSFLQELKILRVPNTTSCMLDPTYMECDGSDAEYGFVLIPITKKAFEKKYKGKKFANFGAHPTDDDKLDEINLCDFYIKKYTETTKQMGPDGSMMDYVEEDEETEKKKTKRTLRKATIEVYRFSGHEELEKTTFPGEYIPIVPFHGEEVWIEGKRKLLSLIRQAKDAQRRINKWATKESQLLDMAPISPVQAPLGAVDDFMEEWGNPEDVMVMRYKQFDAAGKELNKPERLPAPQIPTGFVNAMQEATEHCKMAMGLYNASLGAKSNETSGVAIDARKVEGEVATFHFADNRNRAIQHIGRILVCAIPEIYDTDRIIRIIGDEEEARMVGINGAPIQEGQKQEYDLRKGKYDVRVTTGASFTTKRQEAAAMLGDVITKTPQLMGVMGDIWAKNLDVPGSEALAARLRKTIPKEIIADEEAEMNGKQAPDPEKEEMAKIIEALTGQLTQLEQGMQQMQAENDIKMAELDIKKDELAIKQQDLRLKQIQALQGGNEAAPKEEKQSDAGLLDASPEILQATLEQRLNERASAEAMEAEQAQLAEQKAQEEAAIAAEKEQIEYDLKLADMEQRQQATAAIVQSLQAIQVQLGQLTQQVSQPIAVVRDETGAIVGAQ